MSATKAFSIVLIETWANLLISQDYMGSTQRESAFLVNISPLFLTKTWCDVNKLHCQQSAKHSHWASMVLDRVPCRAGEVSMEGHTQFWTGALVSTSRYSHFLHGVFFSGPFSLPVICCSRDGCLWSWLSQEWSRGPPCAAHLAGIGACRRTLRHLGRSQPLPV